MTRSVCTAAVLIVVCAAGTVSAQSAGSTSPWSAEVNTAATLGHRSSWSVGAEGDYRIVGDIDAFVEIGHIGSVGTNDLDTRARRIASAFGGTSNASYHLTYFDAGVRYHILPLPVVHPYVLLGFGVARVKAETTIAVNGVVIGSDMITFGSDLNGVENRPYLVVGGGATWDFLTRYFIDATYRYGRVSSRTDASAGVDEAGVSTQRVQIGFGVKF
jgi:opacity protein-like surface antigen